MALEHLRIGVIEETMALRAADGEPKSPRVAYRCGLAALVARGLRMSIAQMSLNDNADGVTKK